MGSGDTTSESGHFLVIILYFKKQVKLKGEVGIAGLAIWAHIGANTICIKFCHLL